MAAPTTLGYATNPVGPANVPELSKPVTIINPGPAIAANAPYAVIGASQTTKALGTTGAVGDYLSHIVIQPATTAAGTVTLFDGTTTVYVFTTGTLSDLRPITVPINAQSVSGSWNITTGANVSVTGFGSFT